MKSQNVNGLLSTAPRLCQSKGGRDYCNFCIQTKDGLVNCVAFDFVANEFCTKAKTGMSIQTVGRYTEDGSWAMNGFVIPQVARADRAENYVVKAPEPMRVEALMDKLGGSYVTKRIRAWLANTRSSLGETQRPGLTKILSSFDSKGFWALLDELEKEAGEEWTLEEFPSSMSQTSIGQGNGTSGTK